MDCREVLEPPKVDSQSEQVKAFEGAQVINWPTICRQTEGFGV